jgi:hypothetical protein
VVVYLQQVGINLLPHDWSKMWKIIVDIVDLGFLQDNTALEN